MKYFVLYFLVIYTPFLKAQNLVPNHSFENYVNCPTAATFYEVTPWCGLGGGEEAYNTCFTVLYGPGGMGVPENTIGYQYPRTGNGYGSIELKVAASGTVNANRREYLHVPLTTNLQNGKIYCGTMYVNLINTDKYTTDRIGMALTTNSYVCNQAMPTPQTIAPLNVIPQVENPLGDYITDTLNWIEVSNTFTVSGGEAYLTIGNFYDDANTNISIVNPSATYFVIYFLIDDVSIEEVHPARCKSDTTIMYGDSAVIGNNLSEATLYSWQPTAGLSCTNCANPKASPTVSTTYTVTKTQCKSVTTDFIFINVDNVGVNELNINAVTQLFPNPTNGMLNVELGMLNGSAFIEVYNSIGQQVFKEEIINQHSSFDLHHLNEGIYFVKIVYPNGMSVMKKVVKE